MSKKKKKRKKEVENGNTKKLKSGIRCFQKYYKTYTINYLITYKLPSLAQRGGLSGSGSLDIQDSDHPCIFIQGPLSCH
jgi:hypothetical protein